MKSKSFLFIAFVFLATMGGYFLSNPSYEKSLEAKYYYEMGDFNKSYQLAKKAYEIDHYNKMAFNVMTQSTYSLDYLHFIAQAKKYIEQITQMSDDGEIDQTERAKVRTMSKIVLDSYKKLTPSVVVDEMLIKEAKEYNEKFSKLLQKAHK